MSLNHRSSIRALVISYNLLQRSLLSCCNTLLFTLHAYCPLHLFYEQRSRLSPTFYSLETTLVSTALVTLSWWTETTPHLDQFSPERLDSPFFDHSTRSPRFGNWNSHSTSSDQRTAVGLDEGLTSLLRGRESTWRSVVGDGGTLITISNA